MTESKLRTMFPFLKLPLEVRRKVYLVMRQWPSQQHHAVLRTSKQVYAESTESFDQRALICEDESDLIKRVSKSTTVVLKQIQTLVITLTGTAYLREFQSLEESLVAVTVCGSDAEHFEDVQRMVTCLARLPNVTELKLLCPELFVDDECMEGYSLTLAAWLATNYNQVESLSLTVKFITLDFIAAFRNLHILSFCGYSLTAAADAVPIFRQLDHLESLTLTRPMARIAKADDWTMIKRSIDGEVLRSIKPLKVLTLADYCEDTDDGDSYLGSVRPPKLMNEDIFCALSERHGDSVQNLTIESSYILAPPVLRAMLSFFDSAIALQTLCLDLVDADIGNLTRLSKTIRDIQIEISSDYLPSFGQADLYSIHNTLPNLKKFKYEVYRMRSGKLLCHFKTSNNGRRKYVS